MIPGTVAKLFGALDAKHERGWSADTVAEYMRALELTLLRGMIRYQANLYRVNPDKQALVAYYAKSIEHHLERD